MCALLFAGTMMSYAQQDTIKPEGYKFTDVKRIARHFREGSVSCGDLLVVGNVLVPGVGDDENGEGFGEFGSDVFREACLFGQG